MPQSNYYDEVEIEDFEYDQDEEIYYYPCPCGDQFQISLAALIAGEEEVTCPSCSLVIKVIYNKEVFSSKQEELEKESKNINLAVQKVLKYKAMAGRGRGRPSTSFSMDLSGSSYTGEASPPVLQPSLNYPPLDHKPLPIQLTTEMSYLAELRRDFTEYMRESRNNVQAIVLNEDIERFCEYYEESIAEYSRAEYNLKYDWSRMPAELKLSRKRKFQQQDIRPSKKRKIVDIKKKLTELEKKENMQIDMEEEEDKEEGEEEMNGEEKETGERVKDEEIDEMDDGTDYANEYFENGDNYYSEDDNDDDLAFDT